MIDFRYHIVSLIAVFLALALGLFLGSTTLQSTVTNNLHHQADRVTRENQTLSDKNRLLGTQLGDEQDAVVALGPYAVANRLPGASVVLVSAPGVSSDDRKAITTELGASGASVSADVQLQSAYLDPTQDAVLGGLAEQLKLPGHPLPNANGSTEMSAVLAAVLAERPGHSAASRNHVESALSALSDGKFISVTGAAPTHAATLALLLVPTPSSSESTATVQAENTILLALTSQFRKVTTGVVMAGPTATPPVGNGPLAALASDSDLSKSVSTVDLGSTDSAVAIGRIAVVLALAQPSGTVGQFGLGQSPPVPSASPAS